MTDQERQEEWEVEFQTRLGMICGGPREPTAKELDQASAEADQHVFDCALEEMRQA